MLALVQMLYSFFQQLLFSQIAIDDIVSFVVHEILFRPRVYHGFVGFVAEILKLEACFGVKFSIPLRSHSRLIQFCSKVLAN